jgi:hypothetical protein
VTHNTMHCVLLMNGAYFCVLWCPAVNPPNEDELFEALSAASVQKAEELPLLVRTGERLVPCRCCRQTPAYVGLALAYCHLVCCIVLCHSP